MKNKIIIALAGLSLAAVGVVHANGIRCNWCKGTGFPNPQSPYPCTWCKGTGILDY
jgi:hypothetical protein